MLTGAPNGGNTRNAQYPRIGTRSRAYAPLGDAPENGDYVRGNVFSGSQNHESGYGNPCCPALQLERAPCASSGDEPARYVLRCA